MMRTKLKVLISVLSLKKSTRRLSRWRLQHTDLDINVMHKAEAFVKTTNAVSRLLTTVVNNTDIDDDIRMYSIGKNYNLKSAYINVLQTYWV